jgi:zinc/manganese transport system substrate-binding protein
MGVGRRIGVGIVAVSLGLSAGGCGPSSTAGDSPRPGTVAVVAAENQYGNVASQVGGRYVTVSAVESNPNTDPHSYEVSPGVAREVASAQVVIQNGVGYDEFMTRLEAASPRAHRQVINVQHLLGLPDSTPNPHLWYDPATMPAVARRLAAGLAEVQPSHAAYFQAHAAAFTASLKPWLNAIAAFKTRFAGTPAATTEPVADFLLAAMGIDNLTPFGFEADVMNGIDPSPQDIALEDGFFTKHQVKVFCYNQQVVDALTAAIRRTAINAGVPVVGVYETMPAPGYDYQSWMLAEVDAVEKAVTHGTSTEHL